MDKLIPLFKPSISSKEQEYIIQTLNSGWWGLGKKVEEFEDAFADYIGVNYAVAVNSATAALDLALKAYGINEGEIIVPALTFVSTALAGIYNNCRIVFADIDEETLCIDWRDVEKKITDKTRAVIPVHYGGTYAQSYFSKSETPLIIEDCAHAVGNKLAGKNTACWSFHAVKNLSTGDGGMITTNDKEIYNKLIPLRWCGIDKSTWERTQKKYGWDYSIESVGYKCHMNDLTASIGLAQLERIEELNTKRKMRVLQYIYELDGIKWLRIPKYESNSSWHMFVVRLDRRNEFIDYLLSCNISAGVHYKPLNQYKIFPQTKLPVTDRVWKTLVTLPLYPDMTDSEFDYIIKTIKNWKGYA